MGHVIVKYHANRRNPIYNILIVYMSNKWDVCILHLPTTHNYTIISRMRFKTLKRRNKRYKEGSTVYLSLDPSPWRGGTPISLVMYQRRYPHTSPPIAYTHLVAVANNTSSKHITPFAVYQSEDRGIFNVVPAGGSCVTVNIE